MIKYISHIAQLIASGTGLIASLGKIDPEFQGDERLKNGKVIPVPKNIAVRALAIEKELQQLLRAFSKGNKVRVTKKGRVEFVRDNSGNQSVLYTDLLKILGDKQIALSYWLYFKSSAFKSVYGDWENRFMRASALRGFSYKSDKNESDHFGEARQDPKDRKRYILYTSEKMLSRNIPFAEVKAEFVRQKIKPLIDETTNEKLLDELWRYHDLFIEHMHNHRDLKLHLIHTMLWMIQREDKDLAYIVRHCYIPSVLEVQRIDTIRLSKTFYGEPMIVMHAGGAGISNSNKFRKPGSKGHVRNDKFTGQQGLYFSKNLDQLLNRPGFKDGIPDAHHEYYYALLLYKNAYHMDDPEAQRKYVLPDYKTILNEDLKNLRKAGFDAVIKSRTGAAKDEIVVFEPDQVVIFATYHKGPILLENKVKEAGGGKLRLQFSGLSGPGFLEKIKIKGMRKSMMLMIKADKRASKEEKAEALARIDAMSDSELKKEFGIDDADLEDEQASFPKLHIDPAQLGEIHSDQDLDELGIDINKSLGKVKGKSVYEVVNKKLITLLEGGKIPWMSGLLNAPGGQQLMNYRTKKPYTGVNPWLLSADMDSHHCPFFLTRHQVEKMGGKVKKGAQRFMVCYFGQAVIAKAPPAPAAGQDPETKIIRFLKEYQVYNLADTEGISWNQHVPVPTEHEKIEHCEKVYELMPKRPKVIHGGREAKYQPLVDEVRMPKLSSYKEPQLYYSTLFHELVHATGSPKRLKRDLSGRFGNSKYAFEELIAEIGASYLCAHTGILMHTVRNNAAYLQSWIKSLIIEAKHNKSFFFHAASQGQKAANYILSKQLQKEKSGTQAKKALALGSVASEYGFAPADQKPEDTAETFELPGEIGKFLQGLQRYMLAILISGEKHSSKSEIAKQIANGFIQLGDKVAWVDWEQGGMRSKDTQASMDRNIDAVNIPNIHVSASAPRTIVALKKLAAEYPVIAIDSGTKLGLVTNAWIDELRNECPDTVWIIIMQQNEQGGTRGGAAGEYDAPVVIKTYRPDYSTHTKNYAYLEKSRSNDTALKYNISQKKLIQDEPQVAVKTNVKKK